MCVSTVKFYFLGILVGEGTPLLLKTRPVCLTQYFQDRVLSQRFVQNSSKSKEYFSFPKQQRKANFVYISPIIHNPITKPRHRQVFSFSQDHQLTATLPPIGSNIIIIRIEFLSPRAPKRALILPRTLINQILRVPSNIPRIRLNGMHPLKRLISYNLTKPMKKGGKSMILTSLQMMICEPPSSGGTRLGMK